MQSEEKNFLFEREAGRVKDKPIVICVTLIAGFIACITCILNNAGLLYTLLFTFIALFIFMIIGSIANRFISGVNREVEEAEKAEQQRLEDEQREKEKEEEEIENEENEQEDEVENEDVATQNNQENANNKKEDGHDGLVYVEGFGYVKDSDIDNQI